MALLGTYKLTANTQSFSEDRHMHESVLQEGVVGSGDYKVTPGGSSLQWSVAPGVAWVLGDSTARQGLYPQVNDTTAVTGTVAAGHATNPRLDQVALQIADSSVTGVSNTPTLVTVAGTATAGATLDNRNGAASLPATALLLADILVPAAHSGTIPAANIRDRRKWARGAYRAITHANATDLTLSGTSYGVIFTWTSPRIECSGAPLLLTISFSATSSTTAGSIVVTPAIDGTADSTLARFLRVEATNSAVTHSETWLVSPAAGSHTIDVYGRMTVGNAVILRTNTNGLPQMFIREDVRANADNS